MHGFSHWSLIAAPNQVPALPSVVVERQDGSWVTDRHKESSQVWLELVAH